MQTSTELPPLLQWLTDTLDVSVRVQPLRADDALRGFRVDLSRFRLRLSEHTPCLHMPAALIRQRTAIQLKRHLMETLRREGWLRRNALVLVDGDADIANTIDELKVLCRSETLPPIILDAASQQRVLSGPANSNALIEEISKQAPLTALSVYETSAPVQGAQFFGRESELRDILQKSTTSFLICGNRRMGKTSLVRESLRHLRRESASDNPDAPAAQPPTQLYFDCSIFRNKLEFYAEVIRELDGPREIERLYRDKSFSMVSFLQRMYRARRSKIVLCLDEVDHLLNWDAQDNWQVVATLRALASTTQTTQNIGHADRMERDEDHQPLRVIMAGFRGAQAWAENKRTPLFNFASLMRLNNFDHRTTEQLVVEPMLNLGLTLIDRSALVNRIFRETGGQPNLIQHYCDFIVRRLDQTGSRDVTPKLLDDVLNDGALRSRVTDELMANASNLEQFIIFSFIQQPNSPDHFTLGQADAWLTARGVALPRSDLEHALMALETSGILVRHGREYRFAFSVLRVMLYENWDVGYQLRKILEEGVV